MSDWPKLPLVDLLTDRQVSYGVVQPGNDTKSGVPIVRVKDLKNGSVDTSAPIRVDADIEQRHRRTRLLGNELLLSLVGTVGETAIAPASIRGWNVARAIAVIRPTDVSSKWLQLCFQTPATRSVLQGVLNTTVQATLNLSDLKRIPIPVPPREVRDGIAGVLGALDDKIAVNTKLASIADQYLSNLLLSLIRSEPTSQSSLGEIADINAKSVNPVPGASLRYIDIASVQVGAFDYPEKSAWDDAPSRARRAVRKGDTLWSTVRPNRRSHALNLADDAILVGSTGLAVISPRSTGYAYLYEVTRLPEFGIFLESSAEGSAYPAVRADRFRDAPVPLLDESARIRFEDAASSLREHIYSTQQENRTLAETRAALLPHMMSGRLRVKDAEKQVEEVL